MAASDPLSRVQELGVHSASVVDLLSVALARRESDVENLEVVAKRLVQRNSRVHRLAQLAPVDLSEAAGLEPFECLRCLSAIEIGRRAGGAKQGELDEVNDADDVYGIFKDLASEKREHFCVALLDAKNRLLRRATIHIGTLTMSVVGPREVFREAIREGASSIILVHNHPSGDPTPSPEDVEVTGKIAKLGNEIDIVVHDHLIVGDGQYFSFRKHNLMP